MVENQCFREKLSEKFRGTLLKEQFGEQLTNKLE